MKPIYKHILGAVVAAMTLASCGKEDVEPAPTATFRDYPTFTGSIVGAQTRAQDTSWDEGDKIGIYGGGAVNLSHTHQGNGRFTPTKASEQIFFTDDSEVKFSAYYPYGTPSTSTNYRGKIATYATSTSSMPQKPANQKLFDYLWAEETEGSKADPDVKFKFTHRMSKITLVFKSEEIDVSDITVYSVGTIYTKGTFDPTSGECEKYGTTTGSARLTVKDFNIPPYNGQVVEGEPSPPIIVFPQKLKSNPVTLTITATDAGIGTITGSLSFPDGELKSGCDYQFVIRVSKTRLSIGEVTIKPWGDPVDLGEKEAS